MADVSLRKKAFYDAAEVNSTSYYANAYLASTEFVCYYLFWEGLGYLELGKAVESKIV